MSKTKSFRAAALAAAIAALVGCASVDPPDLEPLDVPAAWEGPIDGSAPLWPNVEWWRNFDSPELNAFIDEVKRTNFALAANRRNVEQAQMALRDANISRFVGTPGLSLSDSVSWSRNESNGNVTSEGRNSGSTSLNAPLVSYSGVLTKELNYQRQLNTYESAIATAYDQGMATIQTAVSAYFNLLLIRDNLVAAEQNLANAERVLGFARARLDAGMTTPIDFLTQQIGFDNQRNSLRSQQQNERSARAALSILVGRNIMNEYEIEGQTLADITLPKVMPGIPSELLWRRPDLYNAEIALENSAINVLTVRRTLFPNISLTSSTGRSSASLVDILSSPGSATLSLSASLSQTLLDTGQRKRNIRTSQIQLQNQLESYRQAVLGAYNQVDIALSSLQQLEYSAEIVARQLETAEEQFRLAELRYSEGVADFQVVLNGQNSLFSARVAVLSNKQARLTAIMNFYDALGGGWEPGREFNFEPGEDVTANTTR